MNCAGGDGGTTAAGHIRTHQPVAAAALHLVLGVEAPRQDRAPAEVAALAAAVALVLAVGREERRTLARMSPFDTYGKTLLRNLL